MMIASFIKKLLSILNKTKSRNRLESPHRKSTSIIQNLFLVSMRSDLLSLLMGLKMSFMQLGLGLWKFVRLFKMMRLLHTNTRQNLTPYVSSRTEQQFLDLEISALLLLNLLWRAKQFL